MAAAVTEITGLISFYRTWHEDRFAFEIAKAAINTILDYLQPKGEPVLKLDIDKHVFDAIFT